MKKSSRRFTIDAIVYILLSFGAVTMLLPFLWMVSVSFRLPADQFSRHLIPNPATLQNYVELWEKLPNQAFPYLLYNSLKLSLLTVVGQVLTCSMAAFAFAVVRFRGRELLFALLLATMMIPSQVSLIPNFILFKYMHLIGTQWPLILPAFWGGAFGTFLLRQYFLTIPRELAESARVEGASLFQIFWHIYLPLAKPALAALAVFTFMGAWNDLLHPLIYLPADLHKTTITVGLSLFQTQYGGKWTVLMAGTLVSVAPLIVVFFVAQRQFIEGISLTGLRR